MKHTWFPCPYVRLPESIKRELQPYLIRDAEYCQVCTELTVQSLAVWQCLMYHKVEAAFN